MKIGDACIYVDSLGVDRPAIVTAVWPGYNPSDPSKPGLNVVFVSNDETKTDPYGRQIERATSVVHREKQPAHGNYWKEAA